MMIVEKTLSMFSTSNLLPWTLITIDEDQQVAFVNGAPIIVPCRLSIAIGMSAL